MGNEGYQILYKWLRYPKRYMYIDLRDLHIHFFDENEISGTTDDPYDPNNANVLTSDSLTGIINQIKEIIHQVKEILIDIKEIAQNIKDILQTRKDLKDRSNNNEEKIEEQDNMNEQQDETLDEYKSELEE
jgi:hypothetical protein